MANPAEVTPQLSTAAVSGRKLRVKLGLSLAGGGFRASLFHVGVLWRMAELDLLRHVEVISTVSGGSITGALYALLFKEAVGEKENLEQADYLLLVRRVSDELKRAIQRDLRTRLFWNPLELVRIMVTAYGLGQRMAGFYDRYLYRRTRDSGDSRGPLLRDLRCSPGGNKIPDLEEHNSNPVKTKVPALILNATSLNSGAPFRFLSVEIGDPALGLARYDEIDSELMPRKSLLDLPSDEVERALSMEAGNPAVRLRGTEYPRLLVQYVAIWNRISRAESPVSWVSLLPPSIQDRSELILALGRASPGELRLAKLAAWYHRRGPAASVTGGATPDEHLQRFWAALGVIDKNLAETARAGLSGAAVVDLVDATLELYYVRSASQIGQRAKQEFERIRVADAVAASASFPPVFTPFRLPGFYDERVVTVLGLTDGGVYDNTGVATLLNEGCTHIVASDTGGVLDLQPRTSSGRLGMSGRISRILMNGVAEQQRSLLRERRRVTGGIEDASGPNLRDLTDRYQLRRLAYFHIGSPPLAPPGDLPAFDAEAVSRMRTDLDCFGDVEIAALVNHGYNRADDYIRAQLDAGEFGLAAWSPPSAHPLELDLSTPAARQRCDRILAAGRNRFFRALRLGSSVAWLGIVLLVAALLLDFTFGLPVTKTLARHVADSSLFVVRGGARAVGSWWQASSSDVWQRPAVALGIVGLASLTIRIGKRYRESRWVGLIRRWARLLSGNGGWLFGFAILWLAAGIAAGAWFSYLTQKRPFLAKTRTR